MTQKILEVLGGICIGWGTRGIYDVRKFRQMIREEIKKNPL